MSPPLERVVVLGAGTMGARLAAHCANHALDVTLLDLTASQAETGLQAAARAHPPSFFLPELSRRIRVGSFHDDHDALRQADWVVEAVIEDLDAKQAVLASVAPRLGPATLFTTNTSGLSVTTLAAALPASLRPRWFGTHFFNPPRYLRLVEVIPAAGSDPEAVLWLTRQIELRLGKDVVVARDTPNFIANRIGLFALLNTLRLMRVHRLSLEQVDALTGPALGWPKSATFRTLDLVGLDTLASVIRNSHRSLSGDQRRELFQVPDFVAAMIARSWLGDKTGQGFYLRRGDEILALDLETFAYRPRQKVAPPSGDLPAAVRGSAFLRDLLDDLFAYASARIGEITADPDDVDRAMRWGYNWQFGPFELQRILTSGVVPRRSLGPAIRQNSGCSLVDLGDGVGGLEFHTKFNVIGGDTVAMVADALSRRDSPFDAFVIANWAENFSAGADLAYLLALVQNEDWDDVAEAVERFQAMNHAIKYSSRPVVVAPCGLTLGGGCEMMLHASRVVAHAELYAGLVEVGVGLIPAGGGTKEMALRTDPNRAFETIALARVSTSAAEARQLRLLRPGDAILAGRERLPEVAKRVARQMADAGYDPPVSAPLVAPGPSIAASLELAAYLMQAADRITAHERKIASRLIHVLSGGGVPAGAVVPEARLLELEREAFLSLCGESKTRERISHRLRTGKSLRN